MRINGAEKQSREEKGSKIGATSADRSDPTSERFDDVDLDAPLMPKIVMLGIYHPEISIRGNPRITTARENFVP